MIVVKGDHATIAWLNWTEAPIGPTLSLQSLVVEITLEKCALVPKANLVTTENDV